LIGLALTSGLYLKICGSKAIAEYREVVFVRFPLRTAGKAGDATLMLALAMIY